MTTKPNVSPLSDDEIIEGLRQRNPLVTRNYFYGYCRIAYHIYDRQYQLQWKPGMDFYSIAHEYYLSLDKHDFRQLEDRKPGMSLKTWMVNGFRFVLLDKLKAFKREYGTESIEERVQHSCLRFDMADDNFSQRFRDMVHEICSGVLGRDSRSSVILQMMLVDGFKGKEVAQQLGLTPSAITQRFHKLMDEVVIPYFKRYYDTSEDKAYSVQLDIAPSPETDGVALLSMLPSMTHPDHSHRITPDHVRSLQPNEIFVFGSNLAGMHGGGAARTARLHFGAVLGHGDGPQGQSYAIPTMQGGVETIRPYVNQFIAYATAHPSQTFLVTPIGCGIAGFVPEDIAPLFRLAASVENIHLPKCFWEYL